MQPKTKDYGMRVFLRAKSTIKHSDGSSEERIICEVLRNITEIHYNFNLCAMTNESMIAFESDILGYGLNKYVKDVVEFETEADTRIVSDEERSVTYESATYHDQLRRSFLATEMARMAELEKKVNENEVGEEGGGNLLRFPRYDLGAGGEMQECEEGDWVDYQTDVLPIIDRVLELAARHQQMEAELKHVVEQRDECEERIERALEALENG